jgi:hypothetical protein
MGNLERTRNVGEQPLNEFASIRLQTARHDG